MSWSNLCCDIYHGYDKVGRLEIVDSRLIKNESYTNNFILRPFPPSTSLNNIISILKNRVICQKRCDTELLSMMGLKEYDSFKIFRNTHGVDIDDFIWFKFDDDRPDLCWDDVRAR